MQKEKTDQLSCSRMIITGIVLFVVINENRYIVRFPPCSTVQPCSTNKTWSILATNRGLKEERWGLNRKEYPVRVESSDPLNQLSNIKNQE